MTQSSLPALLAERASQQPDVTAYTFIDYETDPAGFAESLTWAQVHQGALAVAEELRLCGEVGDRAAIVAPEGLGYIMAFLGVLHARFIAVPLPVPQYRTEGLLAVRHSHDVRRRRRSLQVRVRGERMRRRFRDRY
jgi:acyl-CoA synthetase (AMP-forming)/AMP-acid ligase II